MIDTVMIVQYSHPLVYGLCLEVISDYQRERVTVHYDRVSAAGLVGPRWSVANILEGRLDYL